MVEITDKRVLYMKGALFLVLGVLATTLILLRYPDLRLALMLAVVVWSFCRAYYFAFYVIQHYIDPTYRFAGLGSAVGYLLRRRGQQDGAA
jgi:hypothetical protein